MFRFIIRSKIWLTEIFNYSYMPFAYIMVIHRSLLTREKIVAKKSRSYQRGAL